MCREFHRDGRFDLLRSLHSGCGEPAAGLCRDIETHPVCPWQLWAVERISVRRVWRLCQLDIEPHDRRRGHHDGWRYLRDFAQADRRNSPNFGLSTQVLSNALGTGGADGGFSPLYQFGGSRSLQFAVKLPILIARRRPDDISRVEVPVLRLRFDSSTLTIRRTIRTRFFSSIT